MSESNPYGKQVEAALSAEEETLRHYGLETVEHQVHVPEFNLRLRILEAGSGPPLVIVPGGGGESLQMLPFMAAMSGYRLIAVNRPGAPGSTAVDHYEVDLRRLAVAVLSAALDHFGLGKAAFAANSMGGLWTFWMALDEPGRISAIVQGGCPALLLDTSAPFPLRLMSTPVVGDLLFPIVQPDDAEGALKELRMAGSSPEQTERLPDELAEARGRVCQLPGYQQSWHSMLQTTLSLTGASDRYRLTAGELRQIGHPVLFIWGNNDPFGGIEVGRRAAELLKNARLEVIDAGHIPYLDQPEACAELAAGFLAQPG